MNVYKNFVWEIYQPNKEKFPDWFEYSVQKLEDYEDGFEFDSLYETYNGMQKLDKKDAKKCAKDLIDEYYTDEEIRKMFDDE